MKKEDLFKALKDLTEEQREKTTMANALVNGVAKITIQMTETATEAIGILEIAKHAILEAAQVETKK